MIPEFDIQSRNIVRYLLDRHEQGHLQFDHPISRKVTVHDSCTWRDMGPEVHDDIRNLLRLLGDDIVEMAHNRSKTMCCAAPVAVRNPTLSAEVGEKRALEARDAGAEMMVVGCTGCFNLSDKVLAHGMDIYHITELVQIARGEKPRHRIDTIRSMLGRDLFTSIAENPDLLKKRYVVKDGVVAAV